MCDPVPSHPDNNSACIQCGSQVGYEGDLICDACQRRLKADPWQALKVEQEFPVEQPPALPPTGATPSNPAVDPGLRSDRWSLHQQQFGGPHAGKLKKIGQSMDPKDLIIEVKYYESNHTSMVRVDLTHKPTGLKVSGESFADQKEAIHSRLYGELKGEVEKHYEGAAAAIDKAIQDSMRTVRISSRLAPATRELVVGFAEAMADKLLAAQEKYGYWDGWSDPDFVAECRTELREHMKKGDPRDVANYCAFLWWHKASTIPMELLAAGDIPFEVWQERVACARVADAFASEELPGERRYSGNVISSRILARTNKKVAPAPVAEARTVPEPQLVGELAAKYQMSRVMMEAILSDYLKGGQSPTPEQPSSQVHPDSALPSKPQQ